MHRIAGKVAATTLLMAAVALAAMFAVGIFSPSGVGGHGGGDNVHGGSSAGMATLDKMIAMVGEAAASPPAGGTPASTWNSVEVPSSATHVTFYYSWTEGSRSDVNYPLTNFITGDDNWYTGAQDLINNTRVFKYESTSNWAKTEIETSKNIGTRVADGDVWDGDADHNDIIAVEFKLKANRFLPRDIDIDATDKDRVTSSPEHTLKDTTYTTYMIPPGRTLPPRPLNYLSPDTQVIYYANDIGDRKAGSVQKLTLKAGIAASDRDEITVDFKEFGVPSSIDPDDVTIVYGANGNNPEEAPPGAVEVNGTTVTLTFRTRAGTGAATGIGSDLAANVTTDIIFSRRAGITLPKRAGLYYVAVSSEDTAAKDGAFFNFAEVVPSATLDKLVAMVGEAAASPPAGGMPPSTWNSVEVPSSATHVTFYYSWTEGSRSDVNYPLTNFITGDDNWYTGAQDLINNTRVFKYESTSNWAKTEIETSKDIPTRIADGDVWNGDADHNDIIAVEFKLKANRFLPRDIDIDATDKNRSAPAERKLEETTYTIYMIPPGRTLPPSPLNYLSPETQVIYYINDIDDREAGSVQKLTLKAGIAASDRDEITVDFKEFGVPSSIDPDDVTIVYGANGNNPEEAPPGAVEVNGTTVTLTFRTGTGIGSDLAASVTTDIIFSRRAGITLPKRAGLYYVAVSSEDTAAKDAAFFNFAEVVPNTPEPTATNTPEPTATNTPEPTATNTPEPTATNTPEPTATNTPEPTSTNTPEPTSTNTPEPTSTNTPEPTSTNTPEPTSTNTPEPTSTNTPEPTSTNTPEPTSTNTPEPTSTNTPEPTSTNTPEPTSTNTPEPTSTNTPEPTSTNTPEPTSTNTPAPTNTPEPTSTNTPEPTSTNTPEPTSTNTPEPTATNTPEPTSTNTPEPTSTNTPEPTSTNTPAPTNTPEPTESTDIIEDPDAIQMGSMKYISVVKSGTTYGMADDQTFLLTVKEGDSRHTNVPIDIKLSGTPSHDVSVRIKFQKSADSTATGRKGGIRDFRYINRVITWSAGASGEDLTKTINLRIFGDTTVESDERVRFRVLDLTTDDPKVEFSGGESWIMFKVVIANDDSDG